MTAPPRLTLCWFSSLSETLIRPNKHANRVGTVLAQRPAFVLGTTMANNADGRRKKPRFSAPAPPKRARIPTIRELVEGPAKPLPPPPAVVTKLGNSDLVAGVDIETHDWVERRGNKGEYGQFGFYNLCHPEDFNARIVQIGWAVGTAAGPVRVSEHIVRPVGFCVSSKAAAYHGISQAKAESEGEALCDVLSNFMKDMVEVQRLGGRIVVHHLEFDCGIIAKELHRAEQCFEKEWQSMARGGVCTMDPDIGRWVQTCFGRDAGPCTAKNTMRLQDMAGWLVPSSQPLRSKAHTAGADAHLHLLLYFELQKLVNVGQSIPGNCVSSVR